MSWWGDFFGTLERIIAEGPIQGGASAAATAITGTDTGGTVGTPGSYSGITPDDSLSLTLGGIWTDLTDGRMWRSLGWLLLGVLLMLLGAVMLARESAGRIAGGLIGGVAV